MFSSANSTSPISHCTKCGTPLKPGVRFCTECGAAVGETAPPTSGTSSTADDLFWEALKISLAEGSGIPAMPILQKALAMGLKPENEVAARMSLGDAYREIFGNSELSCEEMLEANEFHQFMIEIEKALELDRTRSLGYFLEPLNIGSLWRLDIMYRLAAGAKEIQQGTHAAIAYLVEKLKAVDYLPRPPLLACLVRLGDYYRQRGAFQEATQCLQKVVDTKPLYPADEERNEELRNEALKILSEIQRQTQVSSRASSIAARFCTKCGKQLLPGARFCTGCGAPVSPP